MNPIRGTEPPLQLARMRRAFSRRRLCPPIIGTCADRGEPHPGDGAPSYTETLDFDNVAAPRFDDHMDCRSRLDFELLDGGRDQADDPGETVGANDGLGVGAVRNDPFDGAGDLVGARRGRPRAGA